MVQYSARHMFILPVQGIINFAQVILFCDEEHLKSFELAATLVRS